MKIIALMCFIPLVNLIRTCNGAKKDQHGESEVSSENWLTLTHDDSVKYDGGQNDSSKRPRGIFHWLYNYFSMLDDYSDYYADECTTNKPTPAVTTTENFSNTESPMIIIKNFNLTIIMETKNPIDGERTGEPIRIKEMLKDSKLPIELKLLPDNRVVISCSSASP